LQKSISELKGIRDKARADLDSSIAPLFDEMKKDPNSPLWKVVREQLTTLPQGFEQQLSWVKDNRSRIESIIDNVSVYDIRHPRHGTLRIVGIPGLHVGKHVSIGGKLHVGDKGYARFGFVQDEEFVGLGEYPRK
jgi:hypothetical protein